MQRMSDHDKRDNPVMQESCPIYGVYSPVGRCGKTTFSLLLGELLARKRSVLYIGFDELPFWDEEVNCPEDLCAIQPEEWSQLILKIAQETEYAAIVLDIGSKLWLADSIFLMCSQLYVPVLSERLAKDQQRRFELWLEKNGSDELLQRMQIVTLPQCAQNGTMKERLEYALWGEAGDYVRNLIKSEW